MPRKKRRRRPRDSGATATATASADAEKALEAAIHQRRAQELALINHAITADQANRVFESYRINDQTFVSPYDALPSGYNFPNLGNADPYYGHHQSTIDDRHEGADLPFLVTLQDAEQARGMARMITTINCPGVGIGENLKNYVINRGFTFTAGTKKNADAPPGLVAAAQDVIEQFLDINSFQCDLDQELLWRAHRDGECFLSLHPQRDGSTKVRQPEPEQIPEPASDPFTPEELWTRWNVVQKDAANWRFGVHTPDHDVQHVYGYHTVWESGGPSDYVPAKYMLHYKRNTDRNTKRGLTDFYPAWQWLKQEQRLLANTSEGAARLSAISYIIQYANATQAQVENMVETASSWRIELRNSGGNQTVHRPTEIPGDVLNIPQGQEYQAGPAGAERGNAFLEVVQGILRQVATRWCMTEGMISGDDSNNNLASMVEAGSRFHAFAETCQGKIGNLFLRLMWRVLEFAYIHGRFERFGYAPGKLSFQRLKRVLTVTAEPPDIDPRGKLERTQHRQILRQEGAMSLKTFRTQEKLDHEEEVKNLEEEPSQTPNPGGPPMTAPGGPPPQGPGSPEAPPKPAGQAAPPAPAAPPTLPTKSRMAKAAVTEADMPIGTGITECDDSGPGHWVTLNDGKHIYIKESQLRQLASMGLCVETSITPGNVPNLTSPDLVLRDDEEDDDKPIAAENAFDEKAIASQAAIQAARSDTQPRTPGDSSQARKGTLKLHGLTIAIEHPKGTTRTGTAEDGTPWVSTLQWDYGEIRRTEGNDGDPVDVFIGPNPTSELVFIIDQVDANGDFDEHKVMLGWDNQAQAADAYQSNYQKGWKVGTITPLTVEQLKAWLTKGKREEEASKAHDSIFAAIELAVDTKDALRLARSIYP